MGRLDSMMKSSILNQRKEIESSDCKVKYNPKVFKPEFCSIDSGELISLNFCSNKDSKLKKTVSLKIIEPEIKTKEDLNSEYLKDSLIVGAMLTEWRGAKIFRETKTKPREIKIGNCQQGMMMTFERKYSGGISKHLIANGYYGNKYVFIICDVASKSKFDEIKDDVIELIKSIKYNFN